MPPIVIRSVIVVLLGCGALVHGLQLTHRTRHEHLLLAGLDIALVAVALTLLAGSLRRGEKGESAAGWGAMYVAVMLVLALLGL